MKTYDLFNIPAILLLFLIASCGQNDDHYRSWEVYLGDPGRNSYSKLDQINRDNVNQLEVAWMYKSGEQRNTGSESNAIVVDGVLFLTTPGIKVVALNAATGEVLWSFDPFEGGTPVSRNRGVMYWEQGSDRRIFHTAGSNLYALNAETGTLIPEFGRDGIVDLREGFDRDPGLISVTQTTPGVVYKNLLIMGSTTGRAPGRIRAYNAENGEIEWICRSLPFPSEFGYDTWDPNAWQLAHGANSWTGLSLDIEREMVFVPTGSPGPDFYSPGTRGAGKNLFGNTVLALDANTGERIWHYQTLRHDLWDYDLPSPPNLVTIERDGRKVDAVVQLTKQGMVFVLDRDTGEPLFPVEERPVPPSDIEGEETWPTQLFPVKPDPIARQYLTEDDLTDISPEAREYAIKRFREVKYQGMYTPPGEHEMLTFPGTRGGAEWGGASYDPETNILYVNANEYGTTSALRKVEVPSVNEENVLVLGQNLFRTHCSSCHGSPGSREPVYYPSLTEVRERLSKAQIVEIMETGLSEMPNFPYISDVEKKAVAEYLFNMEKDGTIPVPEEQTDQEDITYSYTTDYAFRPFVDQDGYPATKPPWGSMNAIDLNTGDMFWKVPLGEYEELTERGIPVTGVPNMGGSFVTAGGLIFIGAAHDEKFRAFDKDTGEVLWEYQLPAVGYATPSTYEIDGKQYVFIDATGGRGLFPAREGISKGDTFIAFSLPDK